MLDAKANPVLRYHAIDVKKINVRMHDTNEGSLTYHQVAIHHYYFVIMKHNSPVL
jgi:hypothetical protein